ncbi:MAG: SH3 domain-containing protein [Limnospira sp.]
MNRLKSHRLWIPFTAILVLLTGPAALNFSLSEAAAESSKISKISHFSTQSHSENTRIAQLQPGRKVCVVGDRVNVHEMPDLESEVLQVLRYGAIVEIAAGEPVDEWVLIGSPIRGWIALEYLADGC